MDASPFIRPRVRSSRQWALVAATSASVAVTRLPAVEGPDPAHSNTVRAIKSHRNCILKLGRLLMPTLKRRIAALGPTREVPALAEREFNARPFVVRLLVQSGSRSRGCIGRWCAAPALRVLVQAVDGVREESWAWMRGSTARVRTVGVVGDRGRELTQPVDIGPVGVVTHLAVIEQPGVDPLDGPAEAE